jgi:hypothetical protein
MVLMDEVQRSNVNGMHIKVIPLPYVMSFIEQLIALYPQLEYDIKRLAGVLPQ